MFSARKVFVFVLLVLSCHLVSTAQTWTGAVNTNWDYPDNWDSGAIPGPGSSVIIPPTSNQPSISFGTAAAAAYVEIQTGATLKIFTLGSLAVNGAGLVNSGTLENNGIIRMGNAGTPTAGFTNLGVVQNNAGALIKIDRTAGFAITHLGSNFTNSGRLVLGSEHDISVYGISCSAPFTNNAGAEIRIDRTSSTGLLISENVEFTNAGKIVIGAISSTGIYSITNQGDFTNMASGVIEMDRSGLGGALYHQSGVFNNSGVIRVGALGDAGSVGSLGIWNKSTFNNNAGGSIHLDRWTGFGLHNEGDFVNMGHVGIGEVSSIGIYGLYNYGNFTNNPCASFFLAGVFLNADSFGNAGMTTIDWHAQHFNIGFENNGIIEYPQGNPVPNVTNNELIFLPVTGECPITDALQAGPQSTFIAAPTWFKDPTFYQTAGTYDAVSNTFTATHLTEGTTVVHIPVSDNANGCDYGPTVRITYDDVTKPVIECPANTTISTNVGCTAAIGAYQPISLSDNCAVPPALTVAQSPGPITMLVSHNDMETVTLTANDGNGNIQHCTFTVTMKDTTRPVIVCPGNITLAADANCEGVLAALNPVSMGDNCASTLDMPVSQSPAPGTPLNGHNDSETVTLSINDGNGNAASCSATVTLRDMTPPVFTNAPANLTVQCNGIPAVANPAASDNCSPWVNIIYNGETRINGSCADSYTLTRKWTATDVAGNATTHLQQINVQDTQAPVFTAIPSNVTVQCSSIPAVGFASATDNCDASVSIAYNGETRTDGSCPDSYILTRKWTATDNCGNTRTKTQRITVQDTQKPNFTSVPANITVQCHEIPAPGAPSAVDNCDAAVGIAYNGETRTNGSCPDSYTLTRKWTASDNCGNTRTVTQRITVRDTQKPEFTAVPQNLTIECSDEVPGVGAATATDHCDAAVTVTFLGQSSVSLGCVNAYRITRTWKATDNCGNWATAVQTITVQDTQAPVFTGVPQHLTLECDQSVPFPGQATATDACGGYVQVTFLGNSSAPGSCPREFVITRTWRALDECGNSATATQTITVQDSQAPEFNDAPANVTVACGASLPDVPVVTASDNCDTQVPVTYLGEENDGPDCPYTVTRTWEAEDDCGNVRTYTQVITVGTQSFGGNPGQEAEETAIYEKHQPDNNAAGEMPATESRATAAPEVPFLSLAPNPARDETWVSFGFPKEGKATILLFDAGGRLVLQKLFDVAPGENNLHLDLSALFDGAYTLTVRAGDQSFAKKLVVVKN